MRRLAQKLLLFASALTASGVGASGARADEHPTIASDGFFVGGRMEPGAALSVAYDLDIYLTEDRVLSLGPAASFSFLGEDGADQGRRQDWLLAIDFLRLKVAMNDGHGPARPYLFVGGGLTYASLPAQVGAPREVFVVPDGARVTAEPRFDATEDLSALVSAGGGIDYYFADSFAIALAVVAHVRASEQDRLPRLWAEALVGLRFGM